MEGYLTYVLGKLGMMKAVSDRSSRERERGSAEGLHHCLAQEH